MGLNFLLYLRYFEALLESCLHDCLKENFNPTTFSKAARGSYFHVQCINQKICSQKWKIPNFWSIVTKTKRFDFFPKKNVFLNFIVNFQWPQFLRMFKVYRRYICIISFFSSKSRVIPKNDLLIRKVPFLSLPVESKLLKRYSYSHWFWWFQNLCQSILCNFLRYIPFAGCQSPLDNYRSANQEQILAWQNLDYRQFFQCGFKQSLSLASHGKNWVFVSPEMVAAEIITKEAANSMPIIRAEEKPEKKFNSLEEGLRTYILNLDRTKVTHHTCLSFFLC